jgi:hypothetical protein
VSSRAKIWKNNNFSEDVDKLYDFLKMIQLSPKLLKLKMNLKILTGERDIFMYLILMDMNYHLLNQKRKDSNICFPIFPTA